MDRWEVGFFTGHRDWIQVTWHKKKKNMKIKLFLALSILIGANLLQGQVIGEFEVWDTLYTNAYVEELINEHNIQNPMGGIPNNWKPFNGYGVTRTPDSFSDEFAIIIHNWYNYAEEQILYKDKITEFPLSISGYYKYIRESEQPDSVLGFAEVLVYNPDNEIIGTANYDFDTTTIYQKFEIPITLLSFEKPDSIQIIFGNSKTNSWCMGNVCNFLFLDDITLDFITSTVDSDAKEFYIYPNPTADKLILRGNDSSNVEISIFNLSGKLIKRVMSSDQIDIRDLSPGSYIVQILNQNKMKSIKIVKM